MVKVIKGSMIVEVQFLLDFLINARKMAHKYYTIKQKAIYIDSIESVIYKNNINCEAYSAKIMTIINDSDMTEIVKLLINDPRIDINAVSTWDEFETPLMYAFENVNRRTMQCALMLFENDKCNVNQRKTN